MISLFKSFFFFPLLFRCTQVAYIESSDFLAVLFDAQCLAACLTQYSTVDTLKDPINTSWQIFQGTYNEDILVCYYSCSRCNDEKDKQVFGCEKTILPSCITGLLFCRDEISMNCNGTMPSKPLFKPSVRFFYTDFHKVEISWKDSGYHHPYYGSLDCKSFTTFILRVKSLNSILYYMVSNYSARIQLFNNLVKSISDSLNISVGLVNTAGFSGFGPENNFQFKDSDPGPVLNIGYYFVRNENYSNEYKLLLNWDLPTINYQNLHSFSIKVSLSNSSINSVCSLFIYTLDNQTLELDKTVTNVLFKHDDFLFGPLSNCTYVFQIISLFSLFFNSSATISIYLPLLCDKPTESFETEFFFLPFFRNSETLRIRGIWNSQNNQTVIYKLELSFYPNNLSDSYFKIFQFTNDTKIDISPNNVAVKDIFYPPISIKYKIEAELLHQVCVLSFDEGEALLLDSYPGQPINLAAYVHFKTHYNSVVNISWEQPYDLGGPFMGYQLYIYSTSVYNFKISVYNYSQDQSYASISMANFTKLTLKMRAFNIFGFGKFTEEIILNLVNISEMIFSSTPRQRVPMSNSTLPRINFYTIYYILFPLFFLLFTFVTCTFIIIFVYGFYFYKKTASRSFPRKHTSSKCIEDKYEIPLVNLHFLHQTLGTGAFGLVKKAILKVNSRNSVIVAVKTTRDDATDFAIEDLIQEIRLVKKIGIHPHIVKFLGCISLSRPICLILEFVPYGDLLSILRKLKKEMNSSNSEEFDSNYLKWFGLLTTTDLIDFSFQISDGMDYLSSLKLVHRDLACRNILVDENKQLKISDFGLTREIDAEYNQDKDKEYYKIHFHNDKLPVRWMAIESITEFIFSTKSDVWSFGITLWEIATLGKTPYSNIPNGRFIQYLFSNHRPEIPTDNFFPEMHQIMESCWQEDPEFRPSFSQLKEKICNIKIIYENQRVPLRSESHEIQNVDFEESFDWELSNQFFGKNRASQLFSKQIFGSGLKDDNCSNFAFSLTSLPIPSTSTTETLNLSDLSIFKNKRDFNTEDTFKNNLSGKTPPHAISNNVFPENFLFGIEPSCSKSPLNLQYSNIKSLLKDSCNTCKYVYFKDENYPPNYSTSNKNYLLNQNRLVGYTGLTCINSSPRKTILDPVCFEMMNTIDEFGLHTEL